MTTREPLPNGVSHSIALTVGSSEPSSIRSDGQATAQVLEARALGDLVGRAAVDGVDADQRREALGAPRRAHRAGDPVAGDELAALDLRGGDVDVVVGRVGRREADEAGAVGRAARRRPRRRGPRGRPRGAAAAGSSRSTSVAGRPRRAGAPRPPRRPRRERRGSSSPAASSASAAASAARRARPASAARRRLRPRPRRPAPRRGASPDWRARMASTSSGLRRRRKPSTPSSLASRCRSASGLCSSAERSRTEGIGSLLRSRRWAPAALGSAAGERLQPSVRCGGTPSG